MSPACKVAAVLGVITLAGCATAPKSYMTSIPTPPADAYACALQQLNLLGYQISNADGTAGFVTGEKQTSGLGTALLTGSTYFDRLTVATFRAPGTETTTLRVTAGSSNESAMGFGSASRTQQAPQESAIRDANALLEICAPGAVVQEQVAR